MRRLLVTLALLCAGFFVSAHAQSPTLFFTPDAKAQALEMAKQPGGEQVACMVGNFAVNGTVIVHRLQAVAVDSHYVGRRWVVLHDGACTDVEGSVGVIHSHPNAERCWYVFPGTSVQTGDAMSFLKQAWRVDAIACGESVVWVDRSLTQSVIPLSD